MRSRDVERELFLDKLGMVGVIAGFVIAPLGVAFNAPILIGAGIVTWIGAGIVIHKCKNH